MAPSAQANEKLPKVEFTKSKKFLPPGNSLASVESLSMPLVQEVVLSADIGCVECQRRVADIMSRMKETESVLVNVLEKTVTLICKYPPSSVKVPSRQLATTLYRKPHSKVAMIKRIFRNFRS